MQGFYQWFVCFGVEFFENFLIKLMRRVQFMSTKNTILKKYDGRFKDIFQEIYEGYADSVNPRFHQILTLR